ncbi:hypothetical protein [Comamonas jiangduensis]|jgi:hypothetical protein|uniref:hypothetical protein n=1 Tax=Comamonas jiangduensis TaxID=1194168 RepID=UPI003BF82D58
MSLSNEVESRKTDVAINSFYVNECASISGRSMLTYEVGKGASQGDFYLRIVRNTGGGVWCKDWIPFEEIEAIVLGAKELKAQTFQCLHPGRSINTGGFVLAALGDLGLVRPMEANTRLHEHVPMSTLELVVQNPKGPEARNRKAPDQLSKKSKECS